MLLSRVEKCQGLCVPIGTRVHTLIVYGYTFYVFHLLVRIIFMQVFKNPLLSSAGTLSRSKKCSLISAVLQVLVL